MHSSTRTILLLLSILLSTTLTVASSPTTAATGNKRHAKIESCSGWALNKLPQLKSFLKDYNDGAESYKNVEVIYIHGRKAVMTIYEETDADGGSEEEENWVEIEQIVLSDYETKVKRYLCDFIYKVHRLFTSFSLFAVTF